MTTFSKWMQSHNMSQSDVASRLGVTRQAVHVWCIGRSPPSLYHALALEALTGGAVSAESWLPRTKQLALKALRGEPPVAPVTVEVASEKPTEEPADEVLYSS